jgi:hypothetical protein
MCWANKRDGKAIWGKGGKELNTRSDKGKEERNYFAHHF